MYGWIYLKGTCIDKKDVYGTAVYAIQTVYLMPTEGGLPWL